MEKYMIEIDEVIMNYLKDKAVPFVDTPNTVLHKLLFGTSMIKIEPRPFPTISGQNIPKALSQILEVIEEVVKEGHSRPDATRIVANRNGTAIQTIIDKYCRQLGKTASEVDMLLGEPGLNGFRDILTNKFPNHRDTVSFFFNNLNDLEDKMEPIAQKKANYNEPPSRNVKTYSSVSYRKKRDTALESVLKNALGERLKEKFGFFSFKGQSQLVFNGARVLCNFSSFYNEQSRWFWGVSKIYWENWKAYDYLALILENEKQDGYSFILFDSVEAQTLFKACGDSAKDGQKKINMRIYADDNTVRFQEWKEFSVETRLQPLKIDPNYSFGKNAVSSPKAKDDPVQAYIRCFASATAQEQAEMLKKLEAEYNKIQ